MKTKNYTIRYYIPCVGADGKQGTIAALLDKINLLPDRLGEVREAGSMIHQVRVYESSPNAKEYHAAFVRFREELPLVSTRSSTAEALPSLQHGEELIEKNHFSLFIEDNGVEIIAYQMSMEGSDITALARYFSHVAIGTPGSPTVALNEVVTGEGFSQLQAGVVKSFEFEVAKPRSKSYAPDPNDTWTKEAMDFMTKTGGTRFSGKIKTTSTKTGLMNSVKEQINLMRQSSLTKKLKVKLTEVDHVIDLFADRVFDKVSIELNKGCPDSKQLFTEIAAAKRANIGLEPYLAKGNEALE